MTPHIEVVDTRSRSGAAQARHVKDRAVLLSRMTASGATAMWSVQCLLLRWGLTSNMELQLKIYSMDDVHEA